MLLYKAKRIFGCDSFKEFEMRKDNYPGMNDIIIRVLTQKGGGR